MDGEIFSQKYNAVMTLGATTLDSGIMSVVVSNLRNPEFILEYLGNVAKEQALTAMTDLANHVDRESYEPGKLAEFQSNAATLARSFAKLLLVQTSWHELIGLCNGPDGFVDEYVKYTQQTS